MPSIPKRGDIRSKAHLEFVACHHCVACHDAWLIDAGETVSQAAHLRGGLAGGISYKPCDCLTVPLCTLDRRGHHEEHDRAPGLFTQKHGINLARIARQLALISPDKRIRDKAKETA
jgi:hypothetical protein